MGYTYKFVFLENYLFEQTSFPLWDDEMFLTFLSGNLLALLNSMSSSNRKTCRRHFLPLPCHTRNSFWRNNRPCSFKFTWKRKYKNEIPTLKIVQNYQHLSENPWKMELTSHSRSESMARRSLPCRNWNRTMASASCSSLKSDLATFISCCSSNAYFPILWTGFNK